MASTFQTDYTINTNLDPQQLNVLGLQVYKMWLQFAVGQIALGGKRLFFPTGRYAASIRFERQGEAEIAIIADENVAPEALWLEVGHKTVDLKTKLRMGKVYRMHNPIAPGSVQAVTGLNRQRASGKTGTAGGIGFTPRYWASARKSDESGFAQFGPNSPTDSWVIPPMPAYSPAMLLADWAKAQSGSVT
jgi:hypothetical protein